MNSHLYAFPFLLAFAASARLPFALPSCFDEVASTSTSYTSSTPLPSTSWNDSSSVWTESPRLNTDNLPIISEIVTATIVQTLTFNLTAAGTIDTAVESALSAQPVTTHAVNVGARGEFIFSPNEVAALIGDIVRFNFLARNHTVTQSSLDSPCSPSGQFDSGFNQFNPSNISNQFYVDFEVKSTDPGWFYW